MVSLPGAPLQGAGAIASVIMALIGDVVSEKHRTRAMALIGMSVGLFCAGADPRAAAGQLAGSFRPVLDDLGDGGLRARIVAMVVPAPKALQGEALPVGCVSAGCFPVKRCCGLMWIYPAPDHDGLFCGGAGPAQRTARAGAA